MERKYAQAITQELAGNRAELESLPGFWIRPRKYTVPQAEEIKRLSLKSVPPKIKSVMVRKQAQLGEGEELTGVQILESMETDEQLSEAMDYFALSGGGDLVRKVLLYGIYEHNLFADDEGRPYPSKSVDEDLVIYLMQNEEVVKEMASIIEAYNRPLAKSSARTSEIAPIGPGAMQASTQEMLFQMEGSHMQ